MFLGLTWYWWIIIGVIALSIPFKVKFMKWWSTQRQEKQGKQKDKWGDENDRN